MRSERVLVWLKYRFIGDAVLTTPLLHALATAYDKPDVLAAPHLMQLLHGEAGLNLIPNPKVKSAGDFFRQVREIRAGKYDVGVIVNRSFRSALMAKMAGVKRRIGFPTEGRGMLLTDSVPYDAIGFEGACYAKLGEHLGLGVPTHPPRLTVSAEESAQGETLRQSATIGLQPGSTVAQRALPPQHAAKVANALTADGHTIALFGGKEERTFAETLLPLLDKPAVDLVGRCSLRETMAALSGLRAYVSADSGIVHTAVALGVPTVTTFSWTPAEKWGHDYPPHTVLVAPNHDMQAMDVDAVIAAVKDGLA